MITMPGEKPNRPATGRHYNPTLRVPKALFGFPGNKLLNNVSFRLNVAQLQSRNASAPETVVVGDFIFSLVDEYRTGSGSDRVELAINTSSFNDRPNRELTMKVSLMFTDPVATAPGSVFFGPQCNPRYDTLCGGFQLNVSSRKSFPAPMSGRDRNAAPKPDCASQL
jgi:hypothetical protein